MLKKIKEFFKKILGIKEQQYLEAPKEKINFEETQKNSNFKEKVAIVNETEKRILELQRDFKAGVIEEEDLSEEDFQALSELYESQIEKAKEAIENYKSRILSVKASLS